MENDPNVAQMRSPRWCEALSVLHVQCQLLATKTERRVEM